MRTSATIWLALVFGVIATAPAQASDANAWTTVQRGLYLTRMGDCAACHTAEPERPFAGDRELPTPFGTIYSANITPDIATGIGDWTPETFYRAMNEGLGEDGEALYPAFPYTHFTYVTRADSDAIFAYLQTLEPVRNVARAPDMLPLVNMRVSVRAWNLLNFEDKDFIADSTKSASWNRGRYLVEGLGHCSACHSPRNLMGAEKDGADRFTGGMAEGWFAPSLRSSGDAGGIGDWSRDELKSFLKHGRNGRTAAFGPMAEVVEKSTRWMTDADLEAVVTYLKDLPLDPAKPVEAASPDRAVLDFGAEIYATQCSACHGPNGKGVPGMFGALAGSSLVESSNPTTVLRLILEGVRAVPTGTYPTPHAMPPFDWKLSDEEVAAVATYVRNAFGNRAAPVTGDDVADLR